MDPYSAAPRERSAYSDNPYPPGHRFSRFHWRAPTYKLNSTAPPSSAHHPQATAISSSCKRRNDESGSTEVKHQCLDPSPYSWTGSSSTLTPATHHSAQMAAGSSRSDHDYSHLNPSSHPNPNPHPHAVPGSSHCLQAFAKDKISGQMLELFEVCQQQPSDLERKEAIRARLQMDIQRLYEGARLFLTGSSVNGLGCRSSDADLCLVIQDMISQKKKKKIVRVLSSIHELFKSLPYIEGTTLIKAKVPILRFRKRGSGLSFDLNFNKTEGISNTFLLRSYTYADVRVTPMIIIVKKWAQYHQINDASKGSIKSYAWGLMVLHYLQTLMEPVLPCLQRNYPNCFNPRMDIDMIPWASKCVPAYFSRNQSSLGELFLGFLRYYATCVRWETDVLSVREACILPKRKANQWKNKYICVEDPIKKDNVTRTVYERAKFETIKAKFAESWQILQQEKDLNSILPVTAVINEESSGRDEPLLLTQADRSVPPQRDLRDLLTVPRKERTTLGL